MSLPLCLDHVEVDAYMMELPPVDPKAARKAEQAYRRWLRLQRKGAPRWRK